MQAFFCATCMSIEHKFIFMSMVTILTEIFGNKSAGI